MVCKHGTYLKPNRGVACGACRDEQIADAPVAGRPEPEVAAPLSDEGIERLRNIRVCCCDPGCTTGPSCKAPVLDDIGADWIDEHFDSIIATIDQLRAKVAELEAVQTECNPMQSAVRAWHEKFGVVVGDSVAIRRPELRANLIEEEARETVEAIRRGDLTEAVDGMCDVLYVVFGTAVEWGLSLQPFFDEVHRTNMLKVGGATRDDGKILKPEGWQPPRIGEMLDDLTNEEIARRKGAK